VLQVKQGSELEFKNMDNINHKITFDSENIYEIEANSSKNIKIEFKYGTGDYGYVCEGVGLTGFLHIVP
jgi:plastocyanin